MQRNGAVGAATPAAEEDRRALPQVQAVLGAILDDFHAPVAAGVRIGWPVAQRRASQEAEQGDSFCNPGHGCLQLQMIYVKM